LYILQERFEEALQVSIQIGDNFLDYYMPPLASQILVENAFKHNIVSADQPLHLHIYTNSSGMPANDFARLTVENSYQQKL
jgi:sensor histidine kinase YesM